MKKLFLNIGLIFLILLSSKTGFAKENHFEPVLQEFTSSSPGYERLSVSLNGDLYVYSYEGKLLPNYPLSLNDQVFTSSPLIADIDKDGNKDIIIISRDRSNNHQLNAISYNQQTIATINLGTEDIFHDPILVHPFSGQNDIIIVDNSGRVRVCFFENGYWKEETITNPGAFVSAAPVNLEKNEFILTFQNQPKAEIYEFNNRWKLKEVFKLDHPFIYPVVSNNFDTFFGINSSNQLSAFDSHVGALKGGFPVNLEGVPKDSPDLINLDLSTPENELSVLLNNGQRQIFDNKGNELNLILATKSLINAFTDNTDLEQNALYSSIYNYANEISNNNFQLVMSEFSKIKIPLFIANSAPTHNNPILLSESGNNTVNENLILSAQNLFDADGDEMKQIINWKENNGSFNTTLNIAFEGETTKDYSEFKHTLTTNNLKLISNNGRDKFGHAVFDGNSSLNITHHNSLNPEDESLNISFWIKTEKSDQNIIIKEDQTNRDKFEISMESGVPKIILANNNDSILLAGNAPVNDNQWHHFFLSINKEEARFTLYIDGTFASFNNLNSIGSIAPSENLIIGNGYTGEIDDIHFYKGKGFSESQIKEIYSNDFHTLLANNTIANENWQACITPNDKTVDGETKCSNSITINLPEQIKITYTEPKNESLISGYDTFLRWEVENGQSEDFQEFEIYLAENDPKNLKLIGTTAGSVNSYHLKIQPKNLYFWKIIGISNGLKVEGDLWSFKVN